ncbi:GNAT family N-acetyltransferase [Niveibacterium sp. 24ML]|uniref:GNAT family N-acetyltransferase n=1 Tax=Niveibacterium sp. 24ML TaxID=2985512 RepID=UPI00226F29A3|nr:GNAT family N-acetyltransferase [Niveibacterium sp. 24ML]MCX9157446.1 GNAT family N-acetyltransferase [Niveibacterium sp. 24ML]
MNRAPILFDLPAQIDTPRLILRPPRAGDGAAVLDAVGDSLTELRQWPANLPWAVPEPELDAFETFCRRSHAQFILREHLNYLILDRDTARLLGVCSLHALKWPERFAEIGFWGRSGTHGQGYVTEAVTALKAFAIETFGAQRIELLTDARNTRARALAERVGFKLEGVLQHYAKAPDGSLHDTALYALIP